jgi:YbgC/YbaW family acyl-CoA thioester hydrolase
VTPADPLQFSARWRVRGYELDSNGHVNNAVYLNWAEEIAGLHAEAAGYGRNWTVAHGGTWVVHHADITWRRPAVQGDEVEVEVRVESVRGARGIRRTWIRRVADGELLAELLVEWAWVRISDGRPTRVPRELIELVERSQTAG